MKQIYFLVLIVMLAITSSRAAKSYEMEVLNLVQINESTFTFDVRMRNTNPSEPFVLELIQWQFSFNTALMNGGSLRNVYLTYVEGTSDLEGDDMIPQSAYFSTDQEVIQWLTAELGDGGQTTFFGDGNWKRIGTFMVQLRNAGNTAFHNFADVAHNLSFVPDQVLVNWCNYTTSNGLYFRDGAPYGTISGQTLTNSLSARRLAGYCFSGTGTWGTAARWNNITGLNANTVPGASNNAIVTGSASLTDSRTLADLTIAQGGYLMVAPQGKLTADKVYNDNPVSAGNDVTIAGWDFEGSGSNLPYSADNGTSSNQGIAPFNTTATWDAFYPYSVHEIPGGSRAPFATSFRAGLGVGTQKDWRIQISTSGYQNLKLSSKQWSDINNNFLGGVGPDGFTLQWSSDGTIWTDISGGTVTVADDWTTGVVSNLALPAGADNLASVFVRWRTNATDKTKNGYSSIDDIIITGEPLPTGLLIQSTAEGTGSLIHSNTGVDAVVQRYLPGVANAWHMISSPVSGMTITGSGWDPGAIGAPNDMYLWNEPAPGTWVNFKNQDGSGGDPSFPVANGGNTLVTSRGYIVNYSTANPTKEFEGPLHAGLVNANLTVNTLKDDWTWRAGWNLIGNPYASGLDFGEITTTGILAENYAHAYDPAFGGGAGGYVQVTTIGPGQGFFVKAAAGSGKSVLTLTPEAQVHFGSFFKQATSDGDNRLVLRLSDGQYFDETKVFVNEASVQDHDFYDATKLFSYNLLAPQLYTRIAEERPLAISSIPGADEGVAIPLSARIKTTGLFTLSIVETAGELVGQPVMVEDLFTHTYHQLDESPYVFSATEGDNADRFKLVFGSVGVADLQPAGGHIWCFNRVLYVRHSGTAVVDVINMAGQVVEHQMASGSDLYSCRLNLPSGVYLVRVVGEGRVSTARILL